MKETDFEEDILKNEIKEIRQDKLNDYIVIDKPPEPLQENEKTKLEKKEQILNAIKKTIFECEEIISDGWIAYFIKERKQEEKIILSCYNFGMIVLSNFRFIFHLLAENSEYESIKEDFFKIPYLLIEEIKKEKILKNTSLIITLRDGTELKFILSNENNNNRNLYKILKKKKLFKKTEELFEFPKIFNSYLNKYETKFNGWEIYNFTKEFKRQGLELEDKGFPLRISNINENFEVSESYPKYLIEPRQIQDNQLILAAKCRPKKRVPTLTYNYKNDLYVGQKKLISGIWRSSQVKKLVVEDKKNEDIRLINEISNLGYKFYIFDARSPSEAFRNKIMGRGNEKVSNYNNNPEYIYCGINKVQIANNAFNKITELSNDKEIMENKNFLSELEDSGWVNFIMTVLRRTKEISKLVSEGNNVLIHCSDGWDRTPQLCTISQILLDPYFRTFEGFAILFEKDFVSFGHKFAIRSGIYDKKIEKKTNPVILQLLDCVYQLLVQFPSEFEFTSEYLLFIAKNNDINLFGTFLFNNESEREEKHAKTETASIWTYLLGDHFENKKKYLNPLYDKNNVTKILTPHYAYYDYVLWTDYFLRNNIYAEK